MDNPVLASLAWVNGMVVVLDGPRVRVLDAASGTGCSPGRRPRATTPRRAWPGMIYGGDLKGDVYALGVLPDAVWARTIRAVLRIGLS